MPDENGNWWECVLCRTRTETREAFGLHMAGHAVIPKDGGGPGLYGVGPPSIVTPVHSVDPTPIKEAMIQTFPSTPFGAVLIEMQAMHDRKNADYGRTGDPLANVRASTDFGVPSWVGAMIRANDKMRRIQKFAADGALANESVEDSLLDLAVYSVIGLILYRESVRG